MNLSLFALYKDKEIYNILFQTAWNVLSIIGCDHKWLGTQAGLRAVLHIWGKLYVYILTFIVLFRVVDLPNMAHGKAVGLWIRGKSEVVEVATDC